ncbi:helix-turn-helix domain-containing protein [Cupriavidus sp. D384]|uniref:helix-turn-helix domain-containing protein n=1 Tax=Cupriavidus sp. D384 TaxID=1538095 RepID=UPI0008306B2A|nr:helix-turn-helix transcriptional regulator [Cupriavidus sp. D384]
MNTLAERLRFARTERGLSQAALAEMVGLSQPMIRKIELGSETSKVVELAVALRVRPEWLATGEGEMEKGPRVFISHSSNDKELISALQRLLQAASTLDAEKIHGVANMIEAMRGTGSTDTPSVAAPSQVAIRTIHPNGEIEETSFDVPPPARRKSAPSK